MPRKKRNACQRPPPERIREWRKHHGLSLVDAAHLLNVTKQTWIRWEKPYDDPKHNKPPHFLVLALREAERHLERPPWFARLEAVVDP